MSAGARRILKQMRDKVRSRLKSGRLPPPARVRFRRLLEELERELGRNGGAP